VVLVASFMALFDAYVANLAAPSIQDSLHASVAEVSLAVAAYLFAFAAGQVSGGREQVGRDGHRRLFTVSMAGFATTAAWSWKRLTELSDRDRRAVYDVVGGDAPVTGYTATITVHEVTEGNRSFVAWSADFDTTGDAGAVAGWVRTGIFQTCLAELERILVKQG
jgi:Polyketide cyclase / dehydrase and lipid transport/Major Facilitator Superfamily